VSALLAEHTAIVVSGTAQNQGRFYDRFEHVIYLRVPLELLLDRVRTRTNNSYGKPPISRPKSPGTLPRSTPNPTDRNFRTRWPDADTGAGGPRRALPGLHLTRNKLI
jgi:hypothetical protein